MLEARHLVKRFFGTAVVSDVSFEVRAGEVVGYLGPNGSGKSTTAKMLTGLLETSTGAVLFDGQDIAHDPVAFRRRLGYVPEEPNLYTFQSAIEYLELVGRLRKLPPALLTRKIGALVELLIDTLPRTHPSWFPPVLIVVEHDATDVYRSLWPRYHELALIGTAALVIVGVVTTAACMWNSRRLPVPIVRRAHEDGVAGRAWKWTVDHVVARTSLRQAGFFFTMQTLSRQVSHRVAIASSLAVGLSLIVITARGRVVVARSDIASVPVAVLAGQSLLLACVLTGFRHAVRIPADLRASTTFTLAWPGNLTPYISGVKHAGWIALVLPTLGGLFIWHATVLGTRLAALHVGVGLVVSALLMETLFLRYRLVPLASGYVPSGELRSRGVASAAALLCVSFALAGVERFALTATAGYLMLVATMVLLTAGVVAVDRASHRPATPPDLDEPTPLPTQRLGLAR